MALTVTVTGATGFIATELVKQLLEKGYDVRGTVRSLKKEEKVAHLKALDAALPGNLTLHEADLLEEGSFDEVVKGADYVFHTASPFFMGDSPDAQKDLVDPAVKGTTTVLRSVAKSKGSVKRVVLTSSVAAIMKMKKGPLKGKVFTDQDWNDENTVSDGPYMYSKTEAEKAARALAEKEGFEIATIHPAFVMGPVIAARADATSIVTMKGFIEHGEYSFFPWHCDVRDIARAHILAAEVPLATGRYIVAQPPVPTSYLSKVLSERFPQFKFPAGKEDDSSETSYDTSKVEKELGLRMHPLKETYVDMATTLIQRGIAKPVAKLLPRPAGSVGLECPTKELG
ncbi:NAD(P)-binding protein [Coccomyxa subellipsoidea C-169]|uniref:Flavanone 4-reductase n=1 Tax=Coccomyxa subellipsoidea (strain C-169) TaxID=574566 RepID=I0Z313_COCSC|nr:NAD(P)-binding protein [Coccomyxa subellipsoidea C-169]EIE25032.1 NAD(P)-binding protein [Coccomyxa subellipsoidea C-169]|eukprot:XP_005649576.1 NAD(P)-binding protein [Coccomyxa subellipsoidea C-169]